jgi:hypothetical protein
MFVLAVASLQHYRFVSRSADERIARSLDIAVEHYQQGLRRDRTAVFERRGE